MPEIKVGVQLASLRMPFKKALQVAARMGVGAVEIDARRDVGTDLGPTGIRQLRKLLEDLNLRVSALGFQTRRGYHVLEDLDARVEATKKAMQLAYALGASVVVNQIGNVPTDTDGTDWQLLVEVLTDLGRHGERTGARLAAETGTESGADLQRLLDELPEGGIGVNFDPGNLIVHGFSPREALADLGHRIAHVHAKDGVRDLARGRGLEVPLGRGTADWPALIGGLENFDFRGYFTVERETSDNPVAEISQSVQFLRNM